LRRAKKQRVSMSLADRLNNAETQAFEVVPTGAPWWRWLVWVGGAVAFGLLIGSTAAALAPRPPPQAVPTRTAASGTGGAVGSGPSATSAETPGAQTQRASAQGGAPTPQPALQSSTSLPSGLGLAAVSAANPGTPGAGGGSSQAGAPTSAPQAGGNIQTFAVPSRAADPQPLPISSPGRQQEPVSADRAGATAVSPGPPNAAPVGPLGGQPTPRPAQPPSPPANSAAVPAATSVAAPQVRPTAGGPLAGSSAVPTSPPPAVAPTRATP
jgi:hypothetical protein